MNTKELTITKQLTPLLTQAQNLEIKTPQDMTNATEILSQANKFLDNIIEDREKLTKPINESLKAIRAKYKPAEDTLNTIIKNIRTSMSSYQTEQLKLKELEEKKIAERIGEGKGKLKMDTAINKIENLSTPAPIVQTDSGKVKFRTDKRLKITDPLAIPREYLEINESTLLSALKLGKSIPGAEIELIQVPVNSRN